jgi:hypothetical protein
MQPVKARSQSHGALLFALGLGLGLTFGFGAGVLSVGAVRNFFGRVLQDEASADEKHPQSLRRPAFELQYPGNWQIKTTDDDYDPDHLFSIESPGQSFEMFIVADGELDPQVSLDAQVSAQTSKVMHDAVQKPFTHWGSHDGVGVLLTGKHLGIAAGSIRIFSFRAGDRTFTLVESTYDDDRAKVAPGFALIERTFKVVAQPGI